MHHSGGTKNTYGTGCFMLQSTGTRAVASTNRLLSTVRWKIGNTTNYALEGGVFIGGAVVQWLRDGLRIIRASSEVGALANSVPDNGGVYFVPAFVGLGAPHWDSDARGSISASLGAASPVTLRALLWKALRIRSPISWTRSKPILVLLFAELRVDGGASANDALMQFQADILPCPWCAPR